MLYSEENPSGEYTVPSKVRVKYMDWSNKISSFIY